MFCNKCGTQVSNNASFCTACGAKFENEAKMNTQAVNMQQSVGVPFGGRADMPQPKKKGKKKMIAGIAGASVLTLGVLAYCLFDTVFFALSPEKYTGNLMDNTIEQMMDESDEIMENLLGFVLSPEEKFTVEANANFAVDREDLKGNASVKIANDPDNKELLVSGEESMSVDYDEISIKAEGFWNDDKIGVAVDHFDVNNKSAVSSDVMDKYLTVPSKNFGDAFMNSELGEELNIDLSNVDLSYTNLMESKGELEPLKESIKDEVLTLLEKSVISDRESVDYRFADDEVGAKKITIHMNGEDICDFGIGVIEAVRDDESIRANFGDDYDEIYDILIDECENEKKYMMDEDFIIEIIEYDGRIVQFSWLWDDGEEGIVVSSTDKDSVFEGIKVELVDSFETVAEIEFTSNWVTEDEEIYFEAELRERNEVVCKTRADINFNEEKYSANLIIPNHENYSVRGKCSKRDGFSITFDDRSFSGLDEDVDFDITLSIKNDVDVQVKQREYIDLFDMDIDEMEEIADGFDF